MAKSFIHELGDKLSKNSTAENLPGHIKEIAPVMYNDGNNNYATIQSALNGKSPTTHTHGNIASGGTLTDTAAAAAGNDYVVIRDADNAKIQTSTIKGTDVADAVSKKHSHSTLTLSTTAQAYDGSHTLALPSTDPYTSARTPASHTHGNITNGGALQTTDVAIASGDKLVVTDASDSNKVARTSVSFDGSTTGTLLSKKGTWENPKEAFLAWGGRNLTGSYGPIDAAMIPTLGACRTAFAKPAGITVEYTRDGGTTWIDYGLTNDQKTALFTTSTGIVIGKADSINKATADGNWANYKARVIITNPAFGLYTTLNKFAIYLSTNGSQGTTVTVYHMSRTTEEAGGSWTSLGSMNVSGWSGWNIFNTSVTTWSGSSSQKSQSSKIMFVFEATQASSEGSKQYNGMIITKIYGYGGVGWSVPSTYAGTGSIYSFDIGQNVTFPANVTATGFLGPLTGNASSASKLSTACKLAVSLSNTSTDTSFDGSADVTNIKTTGTLPVANGGTGATTKKAAEYAINGGMSEATAAMADNFQIVFSRVGTDQNATNGVFIYRQASTVWNYIKSKLSSDTGVNISGNAATATTATKLGSSTLGSGTKPIYLSSGTATECSTYAGGTAVTLNGTSKSASTASFYAPTGAGTSGQLLKSSGSGAPTWATANAALVGITVTSSSVSDGTNTFNKYTHPTYTAQSAKGSATKVPQITTDSTGHVTGITEVTITGVTPASHTHGNITNGGALQTTDVTIASGDKLVITDSSDSNKVARASISFDGSTATKALTQKGTWETFNNYTHPTTSGNKHVPSGGSSGQFLGWDSDGTAKWVANPNTDTKQRIISSTVKNYLTGVTTPPTSSNQDLTGVANTKVYATDGQLDATKFRVDEKCTLQFNSTTNALDFVFA